MKFQYPSHRYVEMFRAFSQFSHHAIGFVSFDDLSLPAWLRKINVMRNIAHPLNLPAILARHGNKDAIFVREFLTVPLLLASPLLLRFRARVLFVLIHNVQMAHLRLRDRLALRLLFRLGFRFVSLETDAGIQQLGIDFDRDQLLVLPLCCPAPTPRDSRQRNPMRPVVGIVGRLRPEKNVLKLLNVLSEMRQTRHSEVEVLVGCDDPAVLAQAQSLGLNVIDTTAEAAYDAALDSIDVLVVNYDRGRYFYRTSGVIADAALRGLVVVCPDYPTFRIQISTPVVIGATFKSFDNLGQAINEALSLIPNAREASLAYQVHRDPRRLAPILDDWLDGHYNGGSFRN